MTYQSLNSIRKNDKLLFDFLIDWVWFIVSDEAHRSLWKVNQVTKNMLLNEDDSRIDIQAEEMLENEIDWNINWKIHLLTTATPRLRDKDVRQDVEEIYSATIQDVADRWDLIIPKANHIWVAQLNIERPLWNNRNIRIEDLSWPLTRYISESWMYVYERITRSYLENKNTHWDYLPWVWFCTTVEQADFVTNYLNSQWIRAIRCTSYKKWYTSDNHSDQDAKNMLEHDKVDIVVTCTKVWEGWDVPILRVALRFTPTQSPVKNLQWNGRIMRTVSAHQDFIYRQNIWQRYNNKHQNNTIIIEPESREVNYTDIRTNWEEHDSKSAWIKNKWLNSRIISTIPWSHSQMYQLWEISFDYLWNNWFDISKIEKNLTVNELIETHIDQLILLWVTDMQTLFTYWPFEYRKYFGWIIISKILWRITYPTKNTLEELWIKLWYLKIERIENMYWEELIEKHRNQLEREWIIDIDTLIKHWSSLYKEKYWVLIIRKILWRLSYKINLWTLEELWIKLWFEKINVTNIIEKHKEELKQKGIVDMISLKEFWPKSYQKTFKWLILKSILWGSIGNININKLEKLWLALWYKIDTVDDYIIRQTKILKEDWVVDLKWLLKYKPNDYQKKYGVHTLWKILWSCKWWVTWELLKELGKKLYNED